MQERVMFNIKKATLLIFMAFCSFSIFADNVALIELSPSEDKTLSEIRGVCGSCFRLEQVDKYT